MVLVHVHECWPGFSETAIKNKLQTNFPVVVRKSQSIVETTEYGKRTTGPHVVASAGLVKQATLAPGSLVLRHPTSRLMTTVGSWYKTTKLYICTRPRTREHRPAR